MNPDQYTLIKSLLPGVVNNTNNANARSKFDSIVRTERVDVVGNNPSCYINSRLAERKEKARKARQERRQKRERADEFVSYDDSDSEEETPQQQQDVLRTSYSICDYLKSREMGLSDRRKINIEYASRFVLQHDMLRETQINLGYVNKVFCSQWLSNRQVAFGTKCNKLLVYDVNMRRVDAIPLLTRNRPDRPDVQAGLHAIKINPSRKLLATGARHSTDLAVYRLPTLDPVCIGSGAHREPIMGMCWLDDQFLVTGSRDSRLALWRINEDSMDFPDGGKEACPTFAVEEPIVSKEVKTAQRIRSTCFNADLMEIAALSLNGYIHIFNARSFKQTLSRKLPNCQDNVSIAYHNSGLYAVSSRSYTLLLDARTLQTVKKVNLRYAGSGFRSNSFEGNILTLGTANGMLLFYDIRGTKYLDSAVHASRAVALKCSKGIVYPEEDVDGFQQVKNVPAIYTHCYDADRMRIFCAGGPLPATHMGNYAGVWQ